MNKAVAKWPLWEQRRLLSIKRRAVRNHEEKLDAMKAEVRTLEQTVRSLEESDDRP